MLMKHIVQDLDCPLLNCRLKAVKKIRVRSSPVVDITLGIFEQTIWAYDSSRETNQLKLKISVAVVAMQRGKEGLEILWGPQRIYSVVSDFGTDSLFRNTA